MSMDVTKIEDRLMARLETADRIVELNFDTVVVKDVVLSFRRNGTAIGSIYNDDGTEKTFARVQPVGDEDFLSVEVPKAFVAEILDAAVSHDMVDARSTIAAYRERLGLPES